MPNDGAYTSGGYYPHGEALSLLVALSEICGKPIPELARSYGQFLAGRLAALHPQFMADQHNVRDFLRSVEPHIHSEVKKLYPEARTPEVHASMEAQGVRVSYASHRPLADVAHGLIEGFIAYFGEDLEVERISTVSEGMGAEFMVVPRRD